MKNKLLVFLLGAMVALVAVKFMERIRAIPDEGKSNKLFNANALYFATIRVENSDTGVFVPFEVQWSDDDVSPFSKGSGPAIIRERENGYKDLVIVGNYLPKGLPIKINAKGMESRVLMLPARRSGILHVGNNESTIIFEFSRVTNLR